MPLMRLPAALLLLGALAAAQDSSALSEAFLAQEREAFAYFQRKAWPEAIAAFERQCAIFPENPRPYYNIACCYALQGDPARAATWLRLAIGHGWRDAEHLGKDSDLDSLRDTREYLTCIAQLARARIFDPDPLPRALPPGAVPPSATALEALRANAGDEGDLQRLAVLLGEHQYRKRLFAIYDERMARLGRYLVENGDARDAAQAAYWRVATAVGYLAQATTESAADRKLKQFAAALVLRTAEDFVRHWPGDPRAVDVAYLRALALREREEGAEEALAELRTLVADHPHHRLAPMAQIERCRLLAELDRRPELQEAFALLKERWGDDPVAAGRMRGRLMRARLLVEGVPNLLDLDARVAERVGAHAGLVLYLCVACDDDESAARLAALAAPNEALLPVVVCVTPADEVSELDRAKWLKEHAGTTLPVIAHGEDAADRLWLESAPLAIVARRDGTVLAIDPTPDQLAALLAQQG